MSLLTDFGENQIAQYFAGADLADTLPPANWRIAPLSAASDGGVSEITGAGIVRFAMPRSTDSWSGTQGPGTTLPSNGTSKTTSNNIEIDMGTAEEDVGVVTHVGFFDLSSGGECWMYAELTTPITTGADVDIKIPVNELAYLLGMSGGASDFLINTLIDMIFRGTNVFYPDPVYLAAMQSGGGEVGGGVGYARMPLAAADMSIAGDTAANLLTVSFPSPTGSWGDIDRLAVYKESSGGEQLWIHELVATKTVGLSRPLVFQAGAISFTPA